MTWKRIEEYRSSSFIPVFLLMLLAGYLFGYPRDPEKRGVRTPEVEFKNNNHSRHVPEPDRTVPNFLKIAHGDRATSGTRFLAQKYYAGMDPDRRIQGLLANLNAADPDVRRIILSELRRHTKKDVIQADLQTLLQKIRGRLRRETQPELRSCLRQILTDLRNGDHGKPVKRWDIERPSVGNIPIRGRPYPTFSRN